MSRRVAGRIQRLKGAVRAGNKRIVRSRGPASRSARFIRLSIVVAPLAAAATLVVAVPASSQPGAGYPRLQSAAAVRRAFSHARSPGTLSPVWRLALGQGYLVPNEAQYLRQKAEAAPRAAAGQAAPIAPAAPLAPVLRRAWKGINGTFDAPPDETGAVGTTRYVELVNSMFAIYNKTGNTPVATGTLRRLMGAPAESRVFDPQVIWDPTTDRFYYSADVAVGNTDQTKYFLHFGFSKTASPNAAAGFCKYAEDFGSEFPDFQKLGDSRDFMIFGFTVFKGEGGAFVGSKLMAVSQPPSGSTCPAASRLRVGISGQLFMSDGFTPAYTPVPANEIDTNADGWAVTGPVALPSKQLALFKVTKGPTGDPVFETKGTEVTVPEYSPPRTAPQKGSTNKIDTGDGRLTQAVAAIDPTRENALAIWTQHTTSGGAGAEVRWYEIDTATATALQEGTVRSTSLYEFNAAISPNRQVDGTTARGGGSMVLNFNTSSATTFPSIKMVSKVGANPQSRRVDVLDGTKPLSGYECAPPATRTRCRWGDYAGATPNPTANQIWNVSQYAVGSGSGITAPATSRTWNFIVTP